MINKYNFSKLTFSLEHKDTLASKLEVSILRTVNL